jgi:hypothetical protein
MARTVADYGISVAYDGKFDPRLADKEEFMKKYAYEPYLGGVTTGGVIGEVSSASTSAIPSGFTKVDYSRHVSLSTDEEGRLLADGDRVLTVDDIPTIVSLIVTGIMEELEYAKFRK